MHKEEEKLGPPGIFMNETKSTPNIPKRVDKNFESLRDHVHDEFRKQQDQSSTNSILALVRDLSSQDDKIPNNPEITHVLKKLVKFAEERRSTHAASQRHFDKLNAIFFWPSIGLTSLTSAASFLSSNFDEHRTGFNVSIGIMASLSTLIVALSETYRYGSKAEQHGQASESYENLRTKLFFKSVQLQTNISGNENEPAMSACEFKAFFTSVEDQITEIARQCKDLVPNSIIQDYKETRFGDTVESLDRNLKTIIAKDRFARIVDKLSKGTTLTSSDKDEIIELEKLAKKNRKKRMKMERV
tara:strand:+ start:10304 stop:11206 length:903 start_codon:yes stop_codon:yes gene_type:complete